jgi:predicted transcriptional regulator
MSATETVVPFPAKQASRKPSSTEVIWSKPVLAHGYTAIPSILIRAQARLGINSTQFNILIQLLEYWQDLTRKPFPRKKEIAERIGINEKTVQTNIAALEKAGLLHREGRRTAAGDWNSNIYHLDGLVGRIKALEPEFTEARNKRREEKNKVEMPKGRRGT